MSFTRASYSSQSTQADRYAQAYRMREEEVMGPKRTVGSALSLIIGLAVCYAGLHYIPILMKPSQVVDAVSPPNATSYLDIKRDRVSRFGAYAQSFFLRRTYLRSGQGLRVDYILPEGAEMDLHVKQCRRIFILEVFHCFTMSQQTLTISDNMYGTKRLRVPQAGFYHFKESIRLSEPGGEYRIIWSRV